MAVGLSRARLAIPKVNQNPKPPKLGNGGLTAPKAAAKSKTSPALGNNQALTAPKVIKSALQPAAPATAAATATPGSTSSAAAAAPASPAPSATSPAPSAERFAIPTWTPATTGEPDPRDSTYWGNVAKLKFTDEQEFAKSEAEEGKSNSDYSFAVQQALQAHGKQERELGENAIKGNLGASGWLDRNQAEDTTAFTNEETHASLSHEEELQAFNAARHALQEGFGIEAAAEMAEAASRYGKAHEAEAEEGAPEVVAQPSSPVAAALGNQKPKKNAVGGANALRPGQAIGNNRKAK